MLSPGEEEAAAIAETEMMKEVTVLGREERNGTLGAQQQHAAGKEKITLPTSDTVENWKMIIEETSDLFMAENFREYQAMVQRVAFVKEKCSDHLKTLASSIDAENTAENKLNCLIAVVHIQDYIHTVYLRVIEVHAQLLKLAGLNQAEASSRSEKRSFTDMTADSDYVKDLEVLPKRLEPGAHAQIEHKEGLTSFDNGCPQIGNFDDLEESHQIALQEFSGFLECYFKHGDIFDNKSNVDEKKYKNDLSSLESLLAGDKKNPSDDHLLIPGPLAAEVSFVQPYLLVVLQMLGSAIDKVKSHKSPSSSEKRSSPDKTMVQKNRIVPSAQSRPRRIADKSIAANGRSIFIFRDDSIEIPVEEKPGERGELNPGSLLQECTDQVLSDLAKQVGIAFYFAGIGIDARATGVVLTPAYVKFIQLRLEKMGTPDMELIQLETKCMPLLSKDSFEKWVKGRDSKWKNIKTDLYGDTALENGDSSTTTAVPSGLVALWNLMTSSRSVLVCRSPLGSDELGEMVGYGAFATVHGAKQNEEYVIKTSRYGAKTLLDREAAVLTELQQKAETVSGLSYLVESKELPVTIGGIDIRLPALILAPRGISVEMHLARSDDKKRALHAIGKDISAALDFIHSRGFTHNDVSPKNILFNELQQEPFLIDFGLAKHVSVTIKGFCGTHRYAHPAVFSNYPQKPWKAEPLYDKSSLAFSMVVLSNNGNHLWKSFQPFDMTKNAELQEAFESWAKKRASISLECLKQLDFSHDWLSWCLAE